jgi:hypothetical protein
MQHAACRRADITVAPHQPVTFTTRHTRGSIAMPATGLKRGDHVSWNSEAGRVRGTITRVVTSAITFKGYTVHASKDEPQYEIKSDTTDHIAMHKGSALRKLRS